MSLITKPALLAACAALAAGGGSAAVLATSAGASPVTPAGGAAGTGTVTLTGPAGHSHTRTGAVTCKTVNGRYVLRNVDRFRHGRRVLRLVVPHYTGPGAYTGRVMILRRHGAAFRGRDLRRVPVNITSTGGSFTYTKTLTGKRHHALAGKTVSVKASWTCSV
jgi:hypothetical protein